MVSLLDVTELDWNDHLMASTRNGLPTHMIARRRELELNVTDAAKLAGVSRNSWDKWEKGRGSPIDSNYAAIERTLQWQRGSIEEILAGRDPVALSRDSPPPIPDGVMIDPADWAAMTEREREQFVRIVTGVRRRRQGARGA